MIQARQTQHPQKLFGCRFRPPEHHVFAQGAVKQSCILSNIANGLAPVRRIDLADVQTIGKHLPTHWQVEARHHP